MQTINIFPKTLYFSIISFNQANDVKIYETGQLTVLCFLNQKTNVHVNFRNILLWVAFSIPLGSLSLLKYPAYQNHFKISKKMVISRDTPFLGHTG
jgi:hypothetical protein